MNKVYIAIAASLVAGFATAAIVLRSVEPEPLMGTGAGAGNYFDASAATEERIRVLEAAVAEERDARQLLEEELLVLFAEFEALRDGTTQQVETAAALAAEPAAREAELFRRRRELSDSDAGRLAALVDAGFSPARAQWILQRENELRVEAMQARFEAQRAGDMQAMFAASSQYETGLREELGDLEYEQFLDANGRPTTVGIGSVLESSPGQLAGLQTGDQIVSYGGERVFSYTELNNQTLQGEPGESVVVDILRDGMPMQIVLPRGPIGIQGGRFGRR